MNPWSRKTLDLVRTGNYLDRLQMVYPHEDGERDVSETIITNIRAAFNRGDKVGLLNQLLSLEKFPYKDSYVGFLRKERASIDRNPETVDRVCERLFAMGADNLINGITQPKEANARRGNQFNHWVRQNFEVVGLSDFTRSTSGIVVLGASELEARDFCNSTLNVGISKRPDFVAKAGRNYVIGEAKFSSSTGGNQGRAFDDGIHLAANSAGNAYKIFILDGVFWIETGSDQYRRISHSSAAIFSAILLNEFLQDLSQ